MSNKGWNIISFLGIAVLFIAVANNLNWSEKNAKRIVRSDARGYYAYLPGTFLYQDMQFEFVYHIDSSYQQFHKEVPFRQEIDGNTINKYPAGVSLLLSPFFAVGHIMSGISEYPQDGYSRWYQVMVNVAAIVYMIIGLMFLFSILKQLNVSRRNRLFILWVIALGTPLFHYTVKEPGMSHVYSFVLISAFIHLTLAIYKRLKWPQVFAASIVLGLIVMTRPINIMILFAVPFFAQNKNHFIQTFRQLFNPFYNVLIGISGFIIALSPQLIYYYTQSGQLWVDSYPGEHFNFLDPHILDFLFSYKKGFFLYTPIAFLALWGFTYIWKKDRYKALSLGAFLILIVYVSSSWWSWWYGGSFSARVMIEYLPFFGILLGFVLSGIKTPMAKKGWITALVLLMLVCQIQTFQYRYEAIHYENMDKELYWDNFLRIDKIILKKGPDKSPN
ncbi:MAG: hypothetical protein AB8F95_20030 [Bacteroidia bacterium]